MTAFKLTPVTKLTNKFKADVIKLVDSYMLKILKKAERQAKLDVGRQEGKMKWDKYAMETYELLADLKPFHEVMEDKYPGSLGLYNELHTNLKN